MYNAEYQGVRSAIAMVEYVPAAINMSRGVIESTEEAYQV